METTTPPPPKQAAVWKPPRLRKLYLAAGTANGSDPNKNETNIWEGSNPAPAPGIPTTNYRMPLSGEPL